VKAYRETARALAWKLGGNPLASASVQCRFYFATKRRRDGDNLLASMKSCFDGLVDAGVFTDDSGLTHLPVMQAKDAKNPRVEIHILTEEDPINGSFPWDPASRRAQEA
jgi:Holliday junction resolvase RusA-like endonuclease